MILFNRNVVMYLVVILFFFFKQKTAYEMRISDWSSDVCSSDLGLDFCRPLTLRFPVEISLCLALAALGGRQSSRHGSIKAAGRSHCRVVVRRFGTLGGRSIDGIGGLNLFNRLARFCLHFGLILPASNRTPNAYTQYPNPTH